MNAAFVTVGLLAGCALGVHAGTCTVAAIRMHKAGRGGLKWFFISLVVTAAPAWVILARQAKRSGGAAHGVAAGGMRLCPHCLHRITPEELAAAPAGVCPRCGLAMDEVHLA
ncbi:MAG: hypothetical protein ABSH10_01500 [Phycisphaerae bacterium]|jgi:hypothetical protein